MTTSLPTSGIPRKTSGRFTCKPVCFEFIQSADVSNSSGQARVTLFAGQSNARTFDYQGGDIAYVPTPYGHYVENTGNTTLRFLEIFNSGELYLLRQF